MVDRRYLGFALSLVVLGLVGCTAGNSNQPLPNVSKVRNSNHIIGGQDVTSDQDFSKTLVGLYNRQEGTLCTCSILSNSILITAGHCVDGYAPSDFLLLYGLALNGPEARIALIDSFAVHPLYATNKDLDADTGDIALIHFSGGLLPGYKPTTLLPNTELLKNGDTTTLAGYGISDPTTYSGTGVLRSVEVKIENVDFGQSEILVNQTEGKGACHGDSGGPAYANLDGKMLLWGLTSHSIDDDDDDCIGKASFTKVAAYAEWIEATSQALNRSVSKNAIPERDKNAAK
jgi:hypothetical protein